MIRKLRERFDGRRRSGDAGLTLVELMIAMVLSITLGGVVVAAIVTSLNVAGATSDGLKSSVDIRLISAYLARDAQGAAGVDPKTAKPADGAGVSVAAGDWGGCTQPGTLVARFSWVEYLTVTTQRDLTITYARNGTELSRTLCVNNVKDSTLVLGRNLSAVSARCIPNADCSGTPTEIELTFSGTNARSPYTSKLSASLRSRGQGEPTISNSSLVSLLALGNADTPSPCSNVTLSTAKLYVVGDAVVANECGPTSINPDTTNIVHVGEGATSLTGNLSDPLAAVAAPSFTCDNSANPTPIGVASADPTVYPQAVVIASGQTVTFDSGRYVFCKGLNVQAGATVTSTGGVLLYVAGNTLSIDAAASVELTAASTGPQRNILAWVPGTQTVRIGTGAHVTRLGGTVYAPLSRVELTGGTGAAAVNIGALVAETIVINGVPATRIGPVPTLDIAPTDPVLPDAEAGYDYTQQMEVIGSGKADLVDPVWSAAGLSPFTINPITGEITGKSTCAVSLTPTIRVVDRNGLAVSRNYLLKATSDLTLTDPGAYVRGTKTLVATLVDTCGGPGTSVTIQYALSGADENLDGEPDWATLCTTTADLDQPGRYTCDWNTAAAPYQSGDTYDLRALAVLPNSTTSESLPVEGVTIDNIAPTLTLQRPSPTPLKGTVTLVAGEVDDGISGIARVEFEYSPKNANSWQNLCTKTAPADNAFQDIYKCEWDTTQFVGAETKRFDLRAVAYDRAGNISNPSTQSDLPVNNSGASISVLDPGTYVRGTVTLQTTPYVPAPATITSVLIQYKPTGGSWTDICTDTTDPYTCSWNTTTLTDGGYSLRAIMIDSRDGNTTTSEEITTNVDNSTFYGTDVQAVNGRWERKNPDRTHPTYWYRQKVGKPDGIDIITLKYSKAVKPGSLISGWNGSSRSIVVRVLDGQFVAMTSSTVAKTSDVMDFCTTWDTTKKGMSCSGSGSNTSPNLGGGTGLGYVKLNADFVDGWDNTANNRKAAILYGLISVSGNTVTIRLGDPCLPVSKWFEGRYCTSGEARWKKSNGFSADSPAGVKTPNKLITMVWIPRATAIADDPFSTPSSTRPAPEIGSPDRDF